MKLTKEEIQRIADLARLNINSEDLGYYSEELSEVLEYVEQLDKVDTKSISPKIQATLLSNVLREDAQHPELSSDRGSVVRRVLDMAPFKKENYVKVKSVFTAKEK